MAYDIKDILEEFGVSFDVQELLLPTAKVSSSEVEELRQTLTGYIKRVSLIIA